MDVFQLTDIDEVLALYNNWKQFEEASHVTFLWTEWEIIPTVGEIHLSLEDELLESVVLEPVHQYLLIDPEPLIIQKQDSPECIDDLTLLEVVMHQYLSLILEDVVVDYFLSVEFYAGLKCAIDDDPHQSCIGDQHFVVETDVVEEVGCADSAFEVGEDIRNIFH